MARKALAASRRSQTAIRLATIGAFAVVPVVVGSRSVQGQVFEQNANGQVLYTTYNAQNVPSNTYSPADDNWNQAQVLGTAGNVGYYGAPTTVVVNQPSNWNTSYYPGQTTPAYSYTISNVTYYGPVDPTPTSDTVIIPAGNIVNDNVSVTMATLNMGAGAVVLVNGGLPMTITGTLINYGYLEINTGGANATTTLNISSGTIIGNGTIILGSQGGTNADIIGTLTQPATHSITGQGLISAVLTNNGTVNANISGTTLTLSSTGMTNNSLFEATNGGNLLVSGMTVAQSAAGLTFAANSSTVSVSNSTVNGGTFNTAGSGLININGTSTINGLTNLGMLNIVGGNQLNVLGNLADNGVIDVNLTGGNATTTFNFAGGTLSGSGSIILANQGGTNAQLTGSLTQSAGHTIAGQGLITAALTNNGVVNANSPGATLLLDTSNMFNSSVFEATGGGLLNISGITVTQSVGGSITAYNGSTVRLTGAAVTSGLLASSGSGAIQVYGTSAINNVSNSAVIQLIGGNQLNVFGTLNDTGQIQVNFTGGNAGTTLNFSNATLSGTGAVVLGNSGGINAVLSGSLTQSAGHSIDGGGLITAALINNGIVNANVGGGTITITSPSLTNNNLLESTAGTLTFSGATVANASGAINASGGGITLAGGTAITGGTLSSVSPNVFTIPSNNAVTLNGVTITAGTEVDQLVATMLTLNGPTITDNGKFVVNTGGNGGTTLQIGSNTLLTGTGVVALNGGGTNALLNISTGATLTQDVNHTIIGLGEINGSFVNNGTVEANYSGQTLTVAGATTNNGLFLATGGGILTVSGSLTNSNGTSLTGGTYEADANSTLNLTGTIVTNAATVIVGGSGATFNALSPLANNSGTVSVYAGGTFNTTSSLNNTGTITTAAASGNLSGGHITITGSFNQSAGQTNDSGSITVNGSTNLAGGTITVAYGGTYTGSVITVGPSGHLIANGTLANLPTLIDQGSVIFGANPNSGILIRSLHTLNMNNSTATINPATTSASRTLLTTFGLNFIGTTNAWSGRLDLSNNDLEVSSGSLSNITNQITEAYSNGTWQGSGGIISSAAATNSTHLTALGAIQNSTNGNTSGPVFYTNFDGDTSIADTDVLIKYTYYGDANLDGKVDGSDYTRIDSGFTNHLTGWFNGDFNYDGVVNGSDYALIDNGFNTQGPALSSQTSATFEIAPTAAASAVPEPTSTGLAAAASVAALRRRRRRRQLPDQ